MEKLPLFMEYGRTISFQKDKLCQEIEDLEFSLEKMSFLNNIEFSKKVMFSHEIKSNNNIEGITVDIDTILSLVRKRRKSFDKDEMLRVFNLSNGYRFILKNKEITKETLKQLYSILSEGLLNDYEKDNMGDYYRNKEGFILFKGRLDSTVETTMNPLYIEKFMDDLINYVNSNNNLDSMTEYFIKSMIAHFYFVCIHPYYDINGRTSRTMSMWYLLNNECYPYIIFNRAINNEFKGYDEVIRNCKCRADVTKFIKEMLIAVKKELEKEYIIESIGQSITSKLSTIDYQTLNYILTMNGIKTLMDFSTIYNRNNDKKSVKSIFDEMIVPLLDKNVLEMVRYTNKYYGANDKNFEFKIKEGLYDKGDNVLKYKK